LSPFLLAQWLLLIVVLMAPRLVHIGENAEDSVRKPSSALTNEEFEKRLRDMLNPTANDDK
jgi:hypothetical protein